MTREIGHLVTSLDVIQRYGFAVTCCGEEFAAWGEGYGSDGFDESCVRHTVSEGTKKKWGGEGEGIVKHAW